MKLHNSDKPWMCSSLKQLILDRQNAFHSGNMPLWKHYRNKVKQAIIIQKQTFYLEKVCYLKQTNSRLWWKLVKRLSGNTKATTSFHIEKKNGSILNDQELVTELNEFFISVNTDIPPLNLHNLPAFLPAIDQLPTIQRYQVCNKLLKLNIMKASGPDNIPSKILKTFAYTLAEPITDIFNVSLSSGVVPEIWKQANISSIPKESPPKILSDFHPISLTPTFQKLLKNLLWTGLSKIYMTRLMSNSLVALRVDLQLSASSICYTTDYQMWINKEIRYGFVFSILVRPSIVLTSVFRLKNC